MASCRLSLFTINLFIWSAFGLLSCYVYGPTIITNFCTVLLFIEANTHLMLQLNISFIQDCLYYL